ncbi:MAG: glycine--tRNA ligase subunit beta, partial [Candidatus Saganbacteria bacterium]|nr:glycine--tRNA ligase subunit beta [Candidatus Saganbacteria bacterium]
FEFTELQGVMGREYALASGESKAVAQGIYEHYLPKFAGDALPRSVEGAIVSIADRRDTVLGCFSIGLIPTGSEDPYMLRRQAHGIVEIALKNNFDILLDETIEKAYKLYEPVFHEYLSNKGEIGHKDYGKIKASVLDFISARLKAILEEEGIRYDIIDAALGGFNDIVDSHEKAKVLKTNWAVGEALRGGEWEKAMKELSKLTKPVDEFFQKVLVMHEDEKIKINRLALLKCMEKMYLGVADFPKIVQ